MNWADVKGDAGGKDEDDEEPKEKRPRLNKNQMRKGFTNEKPDEDGNGGEPKKKKKNDEDGENGEPKKNEKRKSIANEETDEEGNGDEPKKKKKNDEDGENGGPKKNANEKADESKSDDKDDGKVEESGEPEAKRPRQVKKKPLQVAQGTSNRPRRNKKQ